jgi:peptidoglycan/xylan/chitin deacetylase (PgdA/CDA1 family)
LPALQSTHLPVVLLYHRVGAAAVDPWALAVSPHHFSEHLEVLTGGTVVSVSDIIKRLQGGPLLPGMTAITFDDGYAETVSIVRPLLERHGLPATFYVPTGAVNSPREFWWDELESLVLISKRLPLRLSLEIDGQPLDWESADQEPEPGTDEEQRRAQQWRAWEDPAPSPRHELYRELWRRCQRLTATSRERVLGDLRLWAGHSGPARPTHRTLTHNEVRDLASSRVADFGSHTVTHPALAALPLSEQRAEIETGKHGLEDLTGEPARTFAYPFGRRVDYSDETVRLVRRAGFEGACANFNGAIVEGVDPFQLPRLFVQDWDGDEFARLLASLTHG